VHSIAKNDPPQKRTRFDLINLLVVLDGTMPVGFHRALQVAVTISASAPVHN
jgi:hypothetical protein